jgi:hypothetical protein
MPAVLIKVHSSIWTPTTSRKLKVNSSTRLNCEIYFIEQNGIAANRFFFHKRYCKSCNLRNIIKVIERLIFIFSISIGQRFRAEEFQIPQHRKALSLPASFVRHSTTFKKLNL